MKLIRLTVSLAVVGLVFASATEARAQLSEGGAEITLVVPADAVVFCNGMRTTLTGTERSFEVPPMEPNKKYHYEVLVRWKKDGRTVEETRKIHVTSGARVRAVFGQQTTSSDDKEVITTKATKRTPATAINFPKALNLPFDSLRTLGSRIEAARRKPDPVALANMASELAVAEKVSKKTASLTSQALIREAAELAAARKQEAELQASLEIANQMQVAEQDLVNTRTQLGIAQQVARQDQNYLNSMEEPTSQPRTIVANNYTTQYVDVYINGNYMAQLNPGSSQTFTITQRINPTTLKAYGNEDVCVWDPAPIMGTFTKYTWNIQ